MANLRLLCGVALFVRPALIVRILAGRERGPETKGLF